MNIAESSNTGKHEDVEKDKQIKFGIEENDLTPKKLKKVMNENSEKGVMS